MKAVPYLFIALAIAILTGSILMVCGAYFELVHPTVFRKGQDEMAPANAYWFVGSILNFFSSAILLSRLKKNLDLQNFCKPRLELKNARQFCGSLHGLDASRVEAACPGQPAGMLGRLTPLASTE